MKKGENYTARAAAVELIGQVLQGGAYANISINKFLRSHEIGDEERRFLTELVYGTIKAVGTLDWYIEKCVGRRLGELDKHLLNILRVSFFQLLEIPRIPEAVVCSEAAVVAHRFSHQGGVNFINGVLRNFLRQKDSGRFSFPSPKEDEAGFLALKYYHPRWLVKKWLGQFGRAETEDLLAFDNKAAPLCLRVNTLLCTREELLTKLHQLGTEAWPSLWSEDGIVCGRTPGMDLLLRELPGAFYVQDESSMLVAACAEPKPGNTVIDVCAAPGGKTTHAAQLMRNIGRIISCDIHSHKLNLIKENSARLGIKIIEPTLSDGTVFNPEWERTGDIVLADVPCSGLGVLHRRAEARWSKSKRDLKGFPSLQLEILKNAARYVKNSGRLVYSTCTIEQAENHYVIEAFLTEAPEWRRTALSHPVSGELCSELQLLPQHDGIDGFFICVLERAL